MPIMNHLSILHEPYNPYDGVNPEEQPDPMSGKAIEYMLEAKKLATKQGVVLLVIW